MQRVPSEERAFSVAGAGSHGARAAELEKQGTAGLTHHGWGVCGRPCRQEARLELPQRACALLTMTPSKSNLGHGLKNGPKGPTTETKAHKRSDGGDSNREGRGGRDRGLVGLTQGADTPAT